MTKIKKIARLQHMEHFSQSLRNVFNHFTDIFVHFPITHSGPLVHHSLAKLRPFYFPQSLGCNLEELRSRGSFGSSYSLLGTMLQSLHTWIGEHSSLQILSNWTRLDCECLWAFSGWIRLSLV